MLADPEFFGKLLSVQQVFLKGDSVVLPCIIGGLDHWVRRLENEDRGVYLRRFFEPVSHIPDSFHKCVSWGFHFGAQPPNVYIHGPSAAQIVVTPNLA